MAVTPSVKLVNGCGRGRGGSAELLVVVAVVTVADGPVGLAWNSGDAAGG